MPRIRTRLSIFLHGLLGLLPLPAQDKWTGSLHLFRLHIRTLHQLARDRYGRLEAEDLVSEGLHQVGRTLLEKRTSRSSPGVSNARFVADSYAVTVRTLNLPSVVEADGQKITVATFFCPFLEDAKKAVEDPWDVCERTCGERRSLFKGISDGFPFPVQYRAPMMMGRGSSLCVKELTLQPNEPAQ